MSELLRSAQARRTYKPNYTDGTLTEVPSVGQAG